MKIFKILKTCHLKKCYRPLPLHGGGGDLRGKISTPSTLKCKEEGNNLKKMLKKFLKPKIKRLLRLPKIFSYLFTVTTIPNAS